MIINELLNEDPIKGDSIDLIFGDTLIETVIEDIREDGIVVKLDETAIKLILEAKKENNVKLNDIEVSDAKRFAMQHYPGLDPEEAFEKFMVRGLMHSKENDEVQNEKLKSIEDKLNKLNSKKDLNAMSEDDNSSDESFEAYGVYGMKSKPWRKVFKNQAAFEAWLDKNEGNVEVHGTRQLKKGVAENSSQPLSVKQLAAISDEALDKAYGYGRSSPGNTFGWQANLMSAAYAKKMIDAGITDIEKISDAIHKGWNVTAQKFVQNPDQFDDTEKLRQAGKLEAKLQQRAKLMKINYSQLDNEEQEKDRVVARALLQAIKGQQVVAEGYEEYKHPYGKPDRSMNAQYRTEIAHARNRGDYAIADEMEQELNTRMNRMRSVDFERMVDELHAKLMAQKDPIKKQELQAKIDKLHDIARKGLMPESMFEAEYQGRKVQLGKPMKGDVKKSKVYVKGPKGNVVKVNFGDKNMKIKKSNPKRRKSFRARHNCDNPGPRWKARYWSCRAW